jgi:hypothetical protein
MVLEVPIQDLVGTNGFGPLSMAAIMAGCVGEQTTHLRRERKTERRERDQGLTMTLRAYPQ